MLVEVAGVRCLSRLARRRCLHQQGLVCGLAQGRRRVNRGSSWRDLVLFVFLRRPLGATSRRELPFLAEDGLLDRWQLERLGGLDSHHDVVVVFRVELGGSGAGRGSLGHLGLLAAAGDSVLMLLNVVRLGVLAHSRFFSQFNYKGRFPGGF